MLEPVAGALYSLSPHNDRRDSHWNRRSKGMAMVGLRAVMDGKAFQKMGAPGSGKKIVFFTGKERAHLKDVYRFLNGFFPLTYGAGFVSLLLLAYFYKQKTADRILIAGGVFQIGLVLFVIAWIALDFGGFFTSFHNLFFKPGTWKFRDSSMIITLYPRVFWVTGAIGLTLVYAFLAVLQATLGLYLRRSKRFSARDSSASTQIEPLSDE